MTQDDAKQVRAWAHKSGILVSPGRIPARTWDAWKSAGSPRYA